MAGIEEEPNIEIVINPEIPVRQPVGPDTKIILIYVAVLSSVLSSASWSLMFFFIFGEFSVPGAVVSALIASVFAFPAVTFTYLAKYAFTNAEGDIDCNSRFFRPTLNFFFYRSLSNETTPASATNSTETLSAEVPRNLGPAANLQVRYVPQNPEMNLANAAEAAGGILQNLDAQMPSCSGESTSSPLSAEPTATQTRNPKRSSYVLKQASTSDEVSELASGSMSEGASIVSDEMLQSADRMEMQAAMQPAVSALAAEEALIPGQNISHETEHTDPVESPVRRSNDNVSERSQSSEESSELKNVRKQN